MAILPTSSAKPAEPRAFDAHTAPSLALLAALSACLLIFAYQIWVHWFLTDDAFISFRYARNLRDGYGLVFNPGFERVEGYTNLLWVLVLSSCQWLTGFEPHQSANWISAAAGLSLWGGTVAFCWRRERRGVGAWLVVAPALWLALNRSTAVWSTSGLETKLFELLVVAAVLVGIREIERRESGWWRPALLLALAALARPDGILFAGAFFAARFACESYERRLDLAAATKGVLLFAGVVGAQFAFRFAYYGEWLPNTYYAKLDGTSWWDMGGLYLRTFLQEYGAPVWLPLVVVGAACCVWARRPAAAVLIGITVASHALYVAYCGGDHFEFRPVDVYFPLLAVLLYDGLAFVAQRFGAAWAAAWGGASCLAVALIPTLAHLDFPSAYAPGFPGWHARADGNRDLVDLRRHPWLDGVPGVSSYLHDYNSAFETLSRQFVALRQEEHRGFLATVEPEGVILGRMVSEGLLPRDTHIAIPCVGAIPYWSGLRTLDELGLTDKVVARQKMPPSAERAMAHDKVASHEYLVASGVDLIAPFMEPHLVTNDPEVVEGWRRVARQAGPGSRLYLSKPVLGGHTLVAVILAPDPRARFPALDLRPAWE